MYVYVCMYVCMYVIPRFAIIITTPFQRMSYSKSSKRDDNIGRVSA